MIKIIKKIMVSLFFVLLLVSIGFIYGFNKVKSPKTHKPSPNIGQIEIENNDNDNMEQLKDNIENEDKDLQIAKNDEVISPNTEIEYTTFYKKCGHSKLVTTSVSDEMINMKENQFKTYIVNNHPNWEVILFSKDKIQIRIEKDQYCPEHYIIGINNGKVAIYKINERGEKIIYDIIEEQPVNLLKEVDQKKLEKGIVVESEDEMRSVIQNFIS